MLFLTGFTYDPVGNRLSSIDNPTWTYNTDNELMIIGNNVTSMTYDANGNMTGWTDNSGSHALTYDFENRLATFITGSVSASYLKNRDSDHIRLYFDKYEET